MTRLRTAAWSVAAACVLLGAAPVVAREGSAQAPVGDATRGQAVVASSDCFSCHRIGDRGSRFGPDLTGIGSRRTPERLQQALVDPDAELLSEHRAVRLVTRDGATVTGRLLNQDAISVQLINDKEQLKSYLRANLRTYTVLDRGLMSSYQGKLTPEQIADVVSYLASIKD